MGHDIVFLFFFFFFFFYLSLVIPRVPGWAQVVSVSGRTLIFVVSAPDEIVFSLFINGWDCCGSSLRPSWRGVFGEGMWLAWLSPLVRSAD